jgi:uncharacterized protein YbjT (DUF2867 family)
VQANIRDPQSIERALDGAEAVINLPGILFERGRQTFQSVHVDGPRAIAEAAARRGVTHFVQMSALGADLESASAYARSKAAGEGAVREVIPTATVVRPSLVFGPEDSLFNRFAAMATKSPFLPLVGGGGTRYQPVYVGDVASAFARLATDPSIAGRTYELGGPAIYTFRELMELILKVTGLRRLLLPVPYPAAGLIGALGDIQAKIGLLPPPVLTSDQVALLRTDNVVGGDEPGLLELGIQPHAAEPIVPTYLYRYRRGGQFAEAPRLA